MILDQDLVPHDIPPYLSKMRDMYEDLFSGGKGYRGALVFSISKELGLSDENAALLSSSIEYIHNSSLLHDDFVDGAHLRRGKETAWKKYGGGYAILGGDYLLAKVIKNLCGTGSVEVIDYTSASILALVEGEWLQDACHGRACVTKEEMEQVHALKTSALFSWCFKAPALLSKHTSDEELVSRLHRIGDILGALLQRSDDLLDYNIRNGEGKAYFNDLPSGYFNLFTIHLLEGVELSKREAAFSCESMEELVAKFDLNIEATLKSYDLESVRMINAVTSLIDEIGLFSKEFKEELKEAALKIYWREEA